MRRNLQAKMSYRPDGSLDLDMSVRVNRYVVESDTSLNNESDSSVLEITQNNRQTVHEIFAKENQFLNQSTGYFNCDDIIKQFVKELDTSQGYEEDVEDVMNGSNVSMFYD